MNIRRATHYLTIPTQAWFISVSSLTQVSLPYGYISLHKWGVSTYDSQQHDSVFFMGDSIGLDGVGLIYRCTPDHLTAIKPEC